MSLREGQSLAVALSARVQVEHRQSLGEAPYGSKFWAGDKGLAKSSGHCMCECV